MTDPTNHASAEPTTPNADAIRAAVDSAFPGVVAELGRLVRIPSVSWPAFDPAHVAESAEAVAELLRGTGVFELVEIRRAPVEDGSELGQPAIVARRAARNGRPTVLLYAHHDVQPPGKDEDWDTPPFEPTQRGDRLHGRGAADDKAGVMAHIGAIRAFAEASGDFDLGLSVFIEGEEEWASRSFGNFLRENRELLEADAIIVADSGNWDIDTPAITVALRGAVAFNLRVETLAHASHSGMFGGAVPDAMLAAIRMLGTMWDAEGAVAVEGLTSAQLDIPAYDEAQLRAEAGLLEGVSPIGRGSILDRIWAQPAITVTGIDAPDVANASNTLIPSLRVRISARIAPGQDAGEAFEALRAHLEANAPFGAKLGFEDVDRGQAFLVDTSGWAVAETRAAMAEAWGKPAVDTGVGGSIPFIAELVEEFPGAQILVTGVEDPDSRAHSPNESLHLGVFKRALLSEALLFGRLNARGA
ncbi:dipeptidase [Agromyces mediolanus]|uniref:Dipeptidase n=1 Tax=Agromyces mediolanus TaxID=41986 RepID=A0A918KVI5_AGRME|nr:dipeptidase [Agromyces mediolanus]GGR35457.1 dipeptidase [Agromyces mediolanus]GLJ73004.1 dipeptidase [Agromyces mediolanus]